MCLRSFFRKVFCCCRPKDVQDVYEISYCEQIDSHIIARERGLGVLKEGVCFVVTGRLLLICERFSINFLIENDKRDIALHINPRLPQNYIVRNSRVRHVWGREEIATQLPFNLRRGDVFSIEVLITEEVFMISSNGYHFADFKHRLPYRAIRAIEVKGDVEKVKIQKDNVSSYPTRQVENQQDIKRTLLTTPFRSSQEDVDHEWAFYDALKTDVVIKKGWTAKSSILSHRDVLPVPYIGTFERGTLFDGRCICLTGRIKLLPHSFYINLQDGTNIWPHQDIAFHFNPRFSSSGGHNLGKAIVCRNAYYNGRWAKEERCELDTNLRPGKKFICMIRCSANAFKVYVDRKLITSFKFHLQPTIVNTVYIRGDVQLFDVSLMVPRLADNSEDKKTHIIENPNYRSGPDTHDNKDMNDDDQPTKQTMSMDESSSSQYVSASTSVSVMQHN